ncbi:unnamed protein product [Cyprideis torosa]|uniref:Uncharacterized protein n=1 Tax=Cyprideis torosa TaxID=163714 RepID=A0A7R8WCN2_9CRUS|nr:unnamed protein product [Cyprideis torosa]CAG0887701.1 unnamed protein product [Cyprideis torosa]
MDGSPQKSNLEALEALMLEFFHPNTSNSRKREIEDNLKHFEDQRDAWKHILFFLQHTSSDCVFMYCLGALEKIILTMWVSGLQRSEKVEIRTYLMSQLKPTSTDWNVQESRSKDVKTHEQRVEEHRRDQMPPFLKTKMIKLLVIIARVDWPHFYPEFYSNILQMLQNKSTQSLALEFLQITSEELGTPRDDLIFARRQELWKLLVSQLPQTISQVTEILNSILERHVLLVSETPPSSPSGSVTSAHPRHKRPSLMFPLWASPVLSAEDEQLVQRCLSLFTHLFAWIPLDIPPLLNNQCLFRSLFLCASMGIDQNLCDDIWLEESVENTEFSDNGERVPASAWQKFIVPSIELLVLTIQLVPDLFQPLALNPFKEILQIYLQIYLREDSSSSGSSSGGRRRLLVQNPQEATMLHSLLRDLNSHLQFLGRLVQVVATGDSVRHPQPLSPVAQSSPAGDTGAKQTSDRHSDKGCVRLTEELNGLLPTLIDVFSYGSERRLFELSPPDGSPNLPKDFLEVHAQSAATLQSWSLVLSQMQSDVLLLSSVESSPPHRNEHQHILAKEFDFLLNKLLSAAAAMIHPEFPEEIVKACLHLLCSVCSVVRPVNLFQREAMLSVYKEVDGAERFPENCRVLLYRLVTMSLVLSRSGSVVSSLNPQWDARKDHLAQFFNSVTGHFLSFPLDDPGLREAAQPAVIFAVRFLCQQMQLVDNESMKTKERCYAALKDHVERALQMLPFYIETAAVSDELLTFFLVLFRSFRRQMGATLTGEILEKFLALFSRSGISGNFLHEGTHGTRVLESFLRQVFVFYTFIDLEEIYPLVATRTSHEVKGPLYGVLYSLLLNNQRYFFPSQIHLLSERDLPSSNVDNSEEFLAIMEVFGQSFLQPDIDTFRNNLVALERMNERWLLYQKQIFLEHLLPRFLTVFLQALMNQSHQILQDDIAAAIFHMASINLIVFRDQFLPQFLRESVPKLQPSQRENLLAQFKAETDLPSFAQSIQRFISDVRCYVIVNNHLPSGSSVVLHSGR